MYFEAPYPPYDPIDRSGFSYETVTKRWPVILTQCVDAMSRLNHDLFVQSRSEKSDKDLDAKVEEGKKVIEKLSRLKYQMGRDHVLEDIPADGELDVDTYNAELKDLAGKQKNTWFTAPWLFAECYLYRLIRSYYALTSHWKSFDPFHEQKIETFRKSSTSVLQIATTMHELDVEKDKLDEARIAVLFKEMLMMCLWGNATDLSLLTHLSPSDIENLQAVGKEAQDGRKKFILRDDSDDAWNTIKVMKDGRADFVLDNAGFEIFTDMVFADFLVTYTPYVSKVVFHPKLIPWFVSDVTPPDWQETLRVLLDPSFFPSTTSTSNSESVEHLATMAKRWQRYIDSGVFLLSVPGATPLGGGEVEQTKKIGAFWTSPYPYWDMEKRAPELWGMLRESGLVVYKGDLNFRKLTGDVAWPAHTDFSAALGPLAGSFPLLSLRTNKADVVVGVGADVAEELQRTEGNKWRQDGRYALVSFSGAS